jgi:hypothetical protein
MTCTLVATFGCLPGQLESGNLLMTAYRDPDAPGEAQLEPL